MVCDNFFISIELFKQFLMDFGKEDIKNSLFFPGIWLESFTICKISMILVEMELSMYKENVTDGILILLKERSFVPSEWAYIVGHQWWNSSIIGTGQVCNTRQIKKNWPLNDNTFVTRREEATGATFTLWIRSFKNDTVIDITTITKFLDFLLNLLCYKDIVLDSFLCNKSFASFWRCCVMLHPQVHKLRSYPEAENSCLTSRTFITNCNMIRISVSLLKNCCTCIIPILLFPLTYLDLFSMFPLSPFLAIIFSGIGRYQAWIACPRKMEEVKQWRRLSLVDHLISVDEESKLMELLDFTPCCHYHFD